MVHRAGLMQAEHKNCLGKVPYIPANCRDNTAAHKGIKENCMLPTAATVWGIKKLDWCDVQMQGHLVS